MLTLAMDLFAWQENNARTDPTIACVYGESTEETIWISNTAPMCFEQLLGIMMHEALHDTVRVDSTFLSYDEEHQCMFLLGDRIYWS